MTESHVYHHPPEKPRGMPTRGFVKLVYSQSQPYEAALEQALLLARKAVARVTMTPEELAYAARPHSTLREFYEREQGIIDPDYVDDPARLVPEERRQHPNKPIGYIWLPEGLSSTNERGKNASFLPVWLPGWHLENHLWVEGRDDEKTGMQNIRDAAKDDKKLESILGVLDHRHSMAVLH